MLTGYEAKQPPEMVHTAESVRRLGRDKRPAFKSTLGRAPGRHAGE